jgi:hypothetical protein
MKYYGTDDGDNEVLFAEMYVYQDDVTEADIAGKFEWKVMVDSTMRSIFIMEGSNGSVGEAQIIVNNDSVDVDIAIKNDDGVIAWFFQGSNGYVGSFTDEPSNPYTLADTSGFMITGEAVPAGSDSSMVFYISYGNPVIALKASDESASEITLVAGDTLKFENATYYLFDGELINTGIVVFSSFDTVASATNITLGKYNNFIITGTTQIDSFDTDSEFPDWAVGYLAFLDTLQITDGKNIKISGNINTNTDSLLIVQRRGDYFFIK